MIIIGGGGWDFQEAGFRFCRNLAKKAKKGAGLLSQTRGELWQKRNGGEGVSRRAGGQGALFVM